MKYLAEDGKHLPYTDESGKPDHRLMGAAWAALHGGYRGNKYEGPNKDAAISKLRGIYKSEGIPCPDESKASDELTGDDAIECRAAVEIQQTIQSNELLFLPIGLHAITPVSGGIGRPIKVNINQESAAVMERQRSGLAASGKRPYFDFNHEDGPASFWPDGFIWRTGEGVVAKGEWTKRGRDAVEGKDYRAFSPVFHVDNKRSDPAMVICKETADPNMGGLVNNPAFKDLPLWAKNAGSSSNAGASGDNNNNGETEMTNEEIDALRSKLTELEAKCENLSALVAQNAEDEGVKAKWSAAESERRRLLLEIETEELKARNNVQAAEIAKRNMRDAKEKVKAAVKRGAILARDIVSQTQWEARIAADPSMAAMLDAIPGTGSALAARMSPDYGNTRVGITEEAPTAVFGAMAKNIALARRTPLAGRNQLAKEFASIYAREFRGANAERILSFPLPDLETIIMAGDNIDADLGTLSGTLVTQRTLELLKLQFPALTAFTTDFSDQPAQFNQTIMTRTVEIPNVVTYNTSTGWSDADADTADVPVTIDQHKGVPITFNSNILASTVRRLFDEFAPASAYGLAKDMVDALYGNITDANFTNNTVVATASFARTSVLSVGTALSLRGVPSGPGMRTFLLYPTVYEKLSADTSIYTLGAFKVAPIITDRYGDNDRNREFPVTVGGLDVYEAANLPTNNGNVTGFAGSKSALVIATRVPNDYTSVLPGASFGNVQMVTDPDIGITVMLTQYVNHQLGTATSRISLMYGTAAGQSPAGQLLKAATGSGSSR